MEAFTTLSSAMVPLPLENVDTDQIIPARYLKVTDKNGLGKVLFGEFLLPFELSSILLLSAMVGAVLLAKKETKQHINE